MGIKAWRSQLKGVKGSKSKRWLEFGADALLECSKGISLVTSY